MGEVSTLRDIVPSRQRIFLAQVFGALGASDIWVIFHLKRDHSVCFLFGLLCSEARESDVLVDLASVGQNIRRGK